MCVKLKRNFFCKQGFSLPVNHLLVFSVFSLSYKITDFIDNGYSRIIQVLRFFSHVENLPGYKFSSESPK